MFVDVTRSYVDFATRNWPTWWQHRLDVPIVAGIAMLLVAFAITPFLWIIGITSVNLEARAVTAIESTFRIQEAEAALRDSGCNYECKIKQTRVAEDARKALDATKLNPFLVRQRFDPTMRRHFDPTMRYEDTPEARSQMKSVAVHRYASAFSFGILLGLLLPAILVLIYWLFLVSGSPRLEEAPRTKNQPYSALLLAGAGFILTGPFLAAGLCWSNFGQGNSLVSSNFDNLWVTAFFSLSFSALCIAFVKLGRSTDFHNALVSSALLGAAIVVIFIFFLSIGVIEFIGLVSTAVYLVTVCLLLSRVRIPRSFFTLLQAVSFYYAAVIGPASLWLWLPESHLSVRMDLTEPGHLAVLIVVSAALMVFSSFVADRLSHRPR